MIAATLFAAAPDSSAQAQPENAARVSIQEMLFQAVRDNSLPAVKLTIESGADPRARNAKGQTALDAALAKGYFAIAQYLITARAKKRTKLAKPQPKPLPKPLPKPRLKPRPEAKQLAATPPVNMPAARPASPLPKPPAKIGPPPPPPPAITIPAITVTMPPPAPSPAPTPDRPPKPAPPEAAAAPPEISATAGAAPPPLASPAAIPPPPPGDEPTATPPAAAAEPQPPAAIPPPPPAAAEDVAAAPIAPRPTSHVVRRGETLYRIASRYGVDPQRLARLNSIARLDNILIGQRLRLPATASPPKTALFPAPRPKPTPPALAEKSQSPGDRAPGDQSTGDQTDAILVTKLFPENARQPAVPRKRTSVAPLRQPNPFDISTIGAGSTLPYITEYGRLIPPENRRAEISLIDLIDKTPPRAAEDARPTPLPPVGIREGDIQGDEWTFSRLPAAPGPIIAAITPRSRTVTTAALPAIGRPVDLALEEREVRAIVSPPPRPAAQSRAKRRPAKTPKPKASRTVLGEIEDVESLDPDKTPVPVETVLGDTEDTESLDPSFASADPEFPVVEPPAPAPRPVRAPVRTAGRARPTSVVPRKPAAAPRERFPAPQSKPAPPTRRIEALLAEADSDDEVEIIARELRPEKKPAAGEAGPGLFTLFFRGLGSLFTTDEKPTAPVPDTTVQRPVPPVAAASTKAPTRKASAEVARLPDPETLPTVQASPVAPVATRDLPPVGAIPPPKPLTPEALNPFAPENAATGSVLPIVDPIAGDNPEIAPAPKLRKPLAPPPPRAAPGPLPGYARKSAPTQAKRAPTRPSRSASRAPAAIPNQGAIENLVEFFLPKGELVKRPRVQARRGDAASARPVTSRRASRRRVTRKKRPLSGVMLAIGGDLRPGTRQVSPRPGSPDACVRKRGRAAVFCIVKVDWPAEIAPDFTVSTILYQGTRAVVRYDRGRATNYHSLFDTKSFDAVIGYFTTKYGKPTEIWDREIAPFAKPRRPNPTHVWRSIDPRTQRTTILEVRKFDDTRSTFPDTEHGAVRLYLPGRHRVFPVLSTLDVMKIDWLARSDPLPDEVPITASRLRVGR